MCDMKDFLVGFFEHYGHTGMDQKSLSELQLKASIFFKSLTVYTKNKFAIARNKK